MNENKTCLVKLSFEDKSVPSLAGYDFGETTFKNQVKNQIDYSADKITIEFPDDKSAIASSFIEGFFNEIKENIGLLQVRKKIQIKSKYPRVITKINEELDLE